MNTIILSAKQSHLNTASFVPVGEGMQLIRGKPAIAWCIKSVKQNGFSDIKIAIGDENVKLSNFLHYLYPQETQILIDENSKSSSILHSLFKVLEVCDDNTPTQIILGDTYITEDFPKHRDVILSASQIKATETWCLVNKNQNGYLDKVYDKMKNVSLNSKEALIGYYKFSDTKLLKSLLSDKIKEGKIELSAVIIGYNNKKPIYVKSTDKWIDLGHSVGLVKARNSLFNAREFNSIEVDALKGVIIKRSKQKQKLLNEVNWYKSLPHEISVYAPRVFDVKETQEIVSIYMEMYGYSNLAELFLYTYSTHEQWCGIIDFLFEINNVFRKYNEKQNKNELEVLYKIKTMERIDAIKIKNSKIYNMFKCDHIIINDIPYKNYFLIKDYIFNEVNKLLDYKERCIVHGDYCFSNILFDNTHCIVKLIDPRGGITKPTIFGDPRYDIAKLRHSIIGLYDFIVSGFFKLEQPSENSYNLTITSIEFLETLSIYFDEQLLKYGYDLKEIKFIEGLLFLTMIPLHSDDVNRQKAFYLTAIKKLNEVLYD